MRIIGQHGLAAGGAAAGHHPAVAAGVDAAQVQHGLQAVVQAQQCAGCAVIQARQNSGRVLRIARQQGSRTLGAHSRQEARAQQFGVPVAAQVPHHHLGPHQRVVHRPRLGLHAKDHKLQRQHLVLAQPGVDAGGVRLQYGLGLRIERVKGAARSAVKTNRAQKLVRVERGLAQHFAQAAGAGAALKLHLKHAVLRVHIALRKKCVMVGGGKDVRDASGIAHHFHLAIKAGNGGGAAGFGQAEAEHQPGGEQQRYKHANNNQGNPEFAHAGS